MVQINASKNYRFKMWRVAKIEDDFFFGTKPPGYYLFVHNYYLYSIYFSKKETSFKNSRFHINLYKLIYIFFFTVFEIWGA